MKSLYLKFIKKLSLITAALLIKSFFVLEPPSTNIRNFMVKHGYPKWVYMWWEKTLTWAMCTSTKLIYFSKS